MDDETKSEIDFLERRLAWLEDIVAADKAAEIAEEKHDEGMRLNWIVVALFAVELALGAWQVWRVMHHA